MPLLLPDPIREKRLRKIQRHLAEHKEEASMGALASAVKLMLEERTFQQQVAASPILRAPATGEASLMKLAWGFIYTQLNARDFVAASMVLWDEHVFTAKPHCVQLVWNAWMTERMICIIGAGGCGKTYSSCAYLLLEFISDPAWTKIQLASVSKEHLQKNSFGDILRMHNDASMVLPGKADTESISLEKKRAHGIFTLILPGGAEGKATLKGSHTKARPLHPRFGRRSRVFCLVDESQEVSENIYGQIANRFSTIDGDDVDHLKFGLTANPKSIFSKFGACAKPILGWDSIKTSDETWRSEEGWAVISIDAMAHENVIAKRVIYPGFVTWEGVQNWLRKCHGNPDDPLFWTYVRGKFPPAGLASTIIKQQWLTAAEKEFIFDDRTVGKAGADPAFTGDRPTIACARVGRAIAWLDYAGNRHVLDVPMMAIQLDAVTVVPKTPDSQILGDEYMEVIKPLGIEPDGFGVDTTGGGRGPYDIMRHQWAVKVAPIEGDEGGLAPIRAIEYGSSPSEVKIAAEDSLTPKQMFDIMASALWFEAAKLFEFGVVGIGKGVDLKVFAELAARQGGMQPGLGKKLSVESKTEFKRRTGMDSPDLADAALICIHVARITTPNLLPKAPDTETAKPERNVPGWQGFNQEFGTASMDGMVGAEVGEDLITD